MESPAVERSSNVESEDATPRPASDPVPVSPEVPTRLAPDYADPSGAAARMRAAYVATFGPIDEEPSDDADRGEVEWDYDPYENGD